MIMNERKQQQQQTLHQKNPSLPLKTIEDYRRDVKLLKMKYMQLQEKYDNQSQKLQWYTYKFNTMEKISANNLTNNNIINNASFLEQSFVNNNNKPNSKNNVSIIQNNGNFIKYDSQIMEQFSNRCKLYLGMSPESLFRAADINGSNVIKDIIFKQFLLNSRINMKIEHIQRIIQLCDNNCTGNITKQNYYDCLSAFQINQESVDYYNNNDNHGNGNNSNNNGNSSNNRTYPQKTFYKFCENLIQSKISPYICYQYIDSSNNDTFNYEVFYSFTSRFMKNINDTEVIAIYTYLDLHKSSLISKETFILTTKQMMRVVANEKNIDIANFIDLQPGKNSSSNNNNNNGSNGNKGNNNGNGNNNNNKNGNSNNNHDNILDDLYDNEHLFQPNKLQIKEEKVDMKKLLDKFVNNYKLNIPNLLKTIVDNMQDFRSGLVLRDVFEGFQTLKNHRKYSNGDKLLFFKGLDVGLNGSVDYEELIKFYSQYKQPDWPIEFIFYLFARILLILDIDAEQYLKYQGYSSDQVLKKQEFLKFAKSIFYIEQNNPAIELFQYLDKEQRNDIYLSALIDQIDYEVNEQRRVLCGEDADLNSTNKSSISSKKASVKDITELESFKDMDQTSKLQQIKKIALSEVNITLSLMQDVVNELKPTIQDEDYFLKFEMGEDKEIIKTKWDTILNDELSCLKKCIEIIAEMKQQNQTEWTDKEFGPDEVKDPYGCKAMYFSDNEIPAGCPDPEEVRWLRLHEIVNEYITYVGEDNLDSKTKSELSHIHFLYEGASSNDVKQSKYLGDCWFVSALSIIAEYNEYVDGEFDPHLSNTKQESNDMFMMSRGTYPPLFHFLQKYGIYVMKFFKNYKWRYVIIDDRLPCLENGEIIFSHCKTKNEFWVSLIEKAYAKIHTCYQALTSGDIGQGLQDLTGNLSMKLKLDNFRISYDDLESKTCPSIITIGDENIDTRKEDIDTVWKKLQKSKEIFWKLLLNFKDKGCLIGCSSDGDTEQLITLEGERTGIYSGHAYSLNYMMELNYIDEEEKNNHKPENLHQNHRLMIVRNPWGYGEWQLKWSENEDYIEKLNANMPSITKFFDAQELRAQQLGITPPERFTQAEDGKFIICYKDWRRIFNNLFICLQFSDAWCGSRIKGSWDSQFSSGILKKSEESFINFAKKNPQYIIELKNNSKNTDKQIPFFINLAQNDGRLFNGIKYPYEKLQQSMLLCLFELTDKEKNLDKYNDKKLITNSGKYSQRREVQLDQRCLLEYGKRYCIIPSMKKEITESDDEFFFYLNIFARCPRSDVIITKGNGTTDFQIKELGVNAVSQIDYEQTNEFKNILIQSVKKTIKNIQIS